MKKGLKNGLKNAIGLGIGLLVALGIGEGLLRLIPTHFTRYNSTIRYVFDPTHGYKLAPGQRASFSMGCFQNDQISVNSHGFRDSEWRGGKRPKIGILGDSFMEALQVPDDSTTAARLEVLTGREVLNTSLSGLGTAGQYVVYQKHLKAYRPDLLLLFYYPPNDLINNHCALNDSTFNAFFAPCPCAMPGPEGPVFHTDFQDTLPGPSWWDRNLMFSRVFSGLMASGTAPKSARTFDAYRKPYTGQWAEAQLLTLQTLQMLRDTSAAYGSRLVVVTVPSFLSQTRDQNWQMDLMNHAGWDKLPRDFDREYPNQIIHEICDSLEVPIWELEPAFRAYRDEKDLAEPTFFFTCNGHWNSLGHRLAAKTVADSLRNSGWLE